MSPMIYYEEGEEESNSSYEEGEGEGESNSSSSNRSWCNLTPDLVIEIANKVPPLEYLRLRSSCSTWTSLIPSESFPLPWLFLIDFSSFYCLVDQHHRFFSFSLPLPFPLTRITHLPGVLCIGSQDGFLILLDEHNRRVVLFNPLTGATIDLPTSTVRSCGDLLRHWKFIFSHSTVVACDMNRYNTVITHKGITTIINYHFQDAVFHEGKLYGIDEQYRLLRFDINNGGAINREPEMVAPWMLIRFRGIPASVVHLVSLGGDVLMVETRWSYSRSKKTRSSLSRRPGFFVGRFCPGRSRWLRVRDLGGWSLFMSGNYCVGVCVKDVPQLRANCIYFTESFETRGGTEAYRVRIFDMRERSIEFWNRPARWQVNDPPCWFIPSAKRLISN